MSKDMGMPTATVVQATVSTSRTPMTSMGTMNAMSGMASTFSVNTRVTLFFTEWTTTTPTTYVLTIFFLFFLGMLNRFLGALKSQLERRWKDQHPIAPHLEASTKSDGALRGHVRKWSRALGSQNLAPRDEEEIEPLSPAPLPMNEMEKHATKQGKQFWIPSVPWSIKSDGIRALLEFIRALIGYILLVTASPSHIDWLTLLQDVGGHDIQRRFPFCGHWKRTFR